MKFEKLKKKDLGKPWNFEQNHKNLEYLQLLHVK